MPNRVPTQAPDLWTLYTDAASVVPLAVALLACLLAPVASIAQNAAHAYEQTVVSIQQLIESGQLDAARAQLTLAEKKYPADGGLDNLLGVIEIQQDNTAAAHRAFAAAIRHNPRLASAYLNLSRLDMQTAASDPAARAEALELSEKVLQLQPGNDEANYQVATLFNWKQSYQSSLDRLARLSAEARAQIGAEALLCSDQASLLHREATEQAVSALAANSDLTEAEANVCLPALRAAHRADLIESIFAASARLHPLSPAGLRVLGLAQEAQGRLTQARETLETAYAASQTGGQSGSQAEAILIDLTRVAEAAGDHQGALGYLAHARELAPANPGLLYEFGVICLRMNLYGEARKALAEALKLAPDNPDYNYGMGIVASFGGDPAEALPFLEKYHSLRPQSAAGTLALGTACFRAKDYDAAKKWLLLAQNDKDAAPEAHFYLGRIARQEGHSGQAIAELKQSLALRPDQAEVLAELGQIDVQAGNYSEAAALLDRAVQIEPGSYAANFGLLQMYARTGDPRREEQSKRFDAIKEKKEERDRDMMRVLEIRPESVPASPN